MSIKSLIIALAATCFGLASCSDDAYQPGEDNPKGFVQVYFDKTSITEKTTPNEPLALTVAVSRLDSVGEVEVPLTVVCDSNSHFTVPTTVTFAAGETQKVITIPFAGTEEEGQYTCSLSITDPQFNSQYTSLNTTIRLSVVVSQVTMINNMDDLLGSYTSHTTGRDYFNYDWADFDYSQTITFERGEGENTIIMNGLYWDADCPLVGTVDFTNQTITFEQQDWDYYNFCAYNWNTEANCFETGKPVVAKIKPNGEIVIDNFCCTYDWGEGYGLYYYLYGTSATLTKNIDVVGSYTAVTSGSDYWNYEWAPFSYQYTASIEQGDDENTVILHNLYWSDDYPLTGTLNKADRTITFAEQPWGGYTFCAYAWDTENNVFKTGQPVVATIKFNGEIELNNVTCTYDWGEGYGLYYYLWNTTTVLSKTAVQE